MTPSQHATQAAARLAGLRLRQAPPAEIAKAEREFREALHRIGVASCDESEAAKVLAQGEKA